MKVTVIGLGYVGAIVAAGLAGAGHPVTGLDTNPQKVTSFRNGSPDIREPGLTSLTLEVLSKNTFRVCHISEIECLDSQIVFVCTGTPSRSDGNVDLSQVNSAIDWITEKAVGPLTIVMKSTVPPGTGESLIRHRLSRYPGKFAYVMNPEFLREGQALQDWFHPDRTVIGSHQNTAFEQMRELYQHLSAPLMETDITTAEMIKYAANAFLATKISFINEIARLCEKVNADIDTVARGIGLDKRIGPGFLHAGLGYGGSCFPKDTRALDAVCSARDIDFELLQAVITVNNRQRLLALEKLNKMLDGLYGRTVAVLGLAFKPNTDDVREAPALEIIRLLCKEGAIVQACDPVAIPNAARQLPSEVKFFKNSLDALAGASAAVVATEWEEFINLDWASARQIMKEPYAIVDGRNCLPGDKLSASGFKYAGFGRGRS